MPGGLTQLTYYGFQDIAISGNPEITHFKALYRKHSNFSMESIEQTFNGTPAFGQTVTATLNRNGDLIHRGYLRVVLPAFTPTSGKNFRWLNWIGHVLIKSISLEIGGNLIDRQYGEWLHIWNSLTQKMGQQSSYARLVGNVPKLVQPSTSTKPETILYIPLQFFFCQHPGLSLPIIALQNQDVKIHITFRDKNECYWSENGIESGLGDITASLYFDYIFLDTEERALFAKKSHQYLINQVQFSGDEAITSTSSQINLNFTNVSKEIIWVVQKDDHVNRTKMQPVGGPQWFNFTDKADTTNFSGVTMPSLGYGIGTAAFVASNPLLNMPYSHGSSVVNDGVLDGTSRYGAISFQNSNDNDIDLDSLTFQNMFGNGNTTDPVGFSAQLPVFDNGENPVSLAKIMFNNQDRISERDGVYFNYVQHLQHHTNWAGEGVNIYSFALEPEKYQPTGSCNFSAIDRTTLSLTLTNSTIRNEADTATTTAKCRVYSNNYNILRIQGGMCALAYGY
jgi:hypothetical protein